MIITSCHEFRHWNDGNGIRESSWPRLISAIFRSVRYCNWARKNQNIYYNYHNIYIYIRKKHRGLSNGLCGIYIDIYRQYVESEGFSRDSWWYNIMGWFMDKPWKMSVSRLIKRKGGGYDLTILRYGYGSIPINTICRGMNIHLPAILMFTRGTRFWHTAI